MKYLVFMRLMEPYEENSKKMIQIENRRIEKHETWDKAVIFPIHSIATNGKSFMVIETDDLLKMAKYRHDYGGVLEVEFHAIQEFSKIRDLVK